MQSIFQLYYLLVVSRTLLYQSRVLQDCWSCWNLLTFSSKIITFLPSSLHNFCVTRDSKETEIPADRIKIQLFLDYHYSSDAFSPFLHFATSLFHSLYLLSIIIHYYMTLMWVDIKYLIAISLYCLLLSILTWLWPPLPYMCWHG